VLGAGAAMACLATALVGSPLHAMFSTAALALGIRPALLLLGLSPESIRRFEWTRDDVWRVQDATGARVTVELVQASTAVVGPLILLNWRERSGRRRCAVIDCRSIGAHAFCRLRGRLRLEGGGTPRADDHYC
jgi:hypothetical protein